jgi:hypothetical protein
MWFAYNASFACGSKVLHLFYFPTIFAGPAKIVGKEGRKGTTLPKAKITFER